MRAGAQRQSLFAHGMISVRVWSSPRDRQPPHALPRVVNVEPAETIRGAVQIDETGDSFWSPLPAARGHIEPIALRGGVPARPEESGAPSPFAPNSLTLLR